MFSGKKFCIFCVYFKNEETRHEDCWTRPPLTASRIPYSKTVMIIGLTGRNGSGKGEVLGYLKSSGFETFSLSDMLREELKNQNKPVTRENLISMGRELRTARGPGVLAELALKKLSADRNFAIDSFRNPKEVEVLRQKGDFRLIEVTASEKVRFERCKARGRESDPQTLDKFRQIEKAELESSDPAGQQLIKTAALADAVIANDGALKDLYSKIVETLQKLSATITRPSWDQYFMDIAKVVALRGNCMKRKVAAILVKDKRIIATGYNGTPRGVKNCNEGGCPRCNGLGKSGANLEECLCSHAEENAITQSAYHGVNIKGATLYTTYSPCLLCTKMIINSGIAEVVFQHDYPMASLSTSLLEGAGVVLRKL